MEDKIKLLYNTVGRDYNLGTYDEFKEKLQDEEKRKAFYNAVGQEYNLGDYDTFSSKVSAPSAPSAEEVAEEMMPEEANRFGILGKMGKYMGSPSAYAPMPQPTEREVVSQEVLDQRAQMRDDLKASGVIDEMETMKKDARKAKRQSFFEMMGAMPQVGTTGVSPTVFDNSEEEMESRLESVDRSIEAGREYTQNKLMQSTLDEALDMVRQGEINMDDGTFMGNLARGVWDSASRLSTWDMGYSDIVNGLTLNQLVQKWEDDPESLTATEKRVLEAVGMSAAVQEAYAGTTGIGYAVGQSLPQSAAFMVSMGLNPASGAGEAIAKAAVKKMGKQAIKSLGKKGARVAAGMARLGGEAAEAAVMAGTVGLGRVGADALERINGDSRYYIDDDGYIQYGGQEDQATVARATMEAFGTTFVEGYTEGLGRALFDPALDALKGVVRGGVKKSAINQMGEAVLDVKPSTLANAMRAVKKTAKIDSMVGELLEEEVGMMLNWWDNAWTRERAEERGETYIFDLENQLTTLLSTCIMTGAINGAEAAGDYATRRRINKAADNADLAGKAVYGEAWDAMRDKIDTGTPEEVVDALMDAFVDPSMDRAKKRALINYASSRITAQYYNAEETRARGELVHEKQQLVDAFDAGYNSRLPEYYNMSKAVAEAQAALTEYGETTGRTEDINAAIEECYAHPEQMGDILAEMSEQEQMLIEDYIYSKARMDGAYQGRSDKAEDYVDEFAYSMEPFVVTDERGNRTITVANLTRGNSSTPVYVMQNDGKNAFIMYEDGRSEMVLAKELQNVNTQNAERVIDMFRQQTGATMEAETQNAVNYREGVKEPSVGMELRQGDEVLMVTAVNGDEVQVVPAKYNPRTQQMEPTKATPRSISVEEAKQIQNDHIEDEEAKKNFRQGADVTFYVDGEAVNAHVDRGEDADGMYTVRLDRDVEGMQRVGRYTLDELREWTTPMQQGELLQLDSEADKASAEEGENATMSTEEMEQSVSDYVPSEYDKVDAEDFLKAVRANTMEAYQDYLDKHQNGSFREAARRGWWTLDNDFEYHSKEDNDRYISEHVKKAENWLAENVIEPTAEVADNVTDEAAEVADNVEAAPVSMEDVVADLLNQGLEAAEVDDFVAYNTKTAMDKADKLLKKKPTMAQAKGDIAQYKALKAAWEEELLAAQRDVQFWADTAKEVQRQREVRLPQQVAMPTRQMPTPKAKAPKTELSFEGFGDAAMDVVVEILADDAPQNGLELAAAMLSGTGKGTFKLIPESYRRHTGYTTKEQRRFPGLFAKKENGGLTIERMGELVMQADREDGTNFFDQSDPNAGMNAVIEVLSQAATMSDINNYIARAREQRAWEEASAIQRQEDYYEQEAKDAWYMDNYHATEEELEAYNEYLAEFAEEIYGEDSDYEQRIATFAEIQLEYDNQGTDAGLRSSADQGEGLASDREGGRSVGETEQLDRREVLADAAGVAASEDQGIGSSVSAESDVEAEAQEWADITAQRIEELEDEIIDLEDRLVVLEADREAAQLTGEVELIDDAIADVESLLRDAIAERDGLLSLAEEQEVDDKVTADIFEMAEEAQKKRKAKEKSTLNTKYYGQEDSTILEGGNQEGGSRRGGVDDNLHGGEQTEVQKSSSDNRGGDNRSLGTAQARDTGGLVYSRRVAIDNTPLRDLRKHIRDIQRQIYKAEITKDVDTEYVNSLKEDLEYAKEVLAKKEDNKWGVEDLQPISLETAEAMFNEWNDDADVKALFSRVFEVFGKFGIDIVFDDTYKVGEKKAVINLTKKLIRLPMHSVYSDSISNQDKANLMLHEMIHGVTSYVLHAYEEGPEYRERKGVSLSGGMMEAARQLNEIHRIITRDKRFFGKQGVKDVHEMVSELSDPEFRALLKETTIWDKIVNALKQLLGIDVENNALDGASKALDYILDNADVEQYNIIANRLEPQAYGASEENLRFREKEESKELIAVHNISEDNLKKVLEAGSLIMPSIAITKADMGHDSFGEISLLFDKSTINPSDRRNKVYGGDAWTPRFPEVRVKIDSDVVKRVREVIYDAIKDERLRSAYSISAELHPSNVEDAISEYGIDSYYRQEWMKLAYLLANGKRVKIPMRKKSYGYGTERIYELIKERGLSVRDIYNDSESFYDNNPDFVAEVKEIVNDAKLANVPAEQRDELRATFEAKPFRFNLFDLYIGQALQMEDDIKSGAPKEFLDMQALRDLVEKKVKTDNAEYNKWVDNLFEGIVEKRGIRNNRDLYTPSGNHRSWEQLYDPATPANILKHMLAVNEQGGSGGLFDSNIMGASAETYDSIEEIREKGKKRLKKLPYEEYDEWSESVGDRMSDIVDDFLTDRDKAKFGSSIDAKIEITNAVAKDKTAKGIYKHMKREYPNFTMEHAKQVEEIVKEIQEFATGYFEAKPQRIVSVNEVMAAVVPSNASKEIVDALKSNGIEVITYKKGDEEARKRVVKRVSSSMDIRFRDGDFDGEIEGLNAEEQEIVAKAKADGTYLKAPNGADTNLTPEQWVRVRTKNFIRWFGDWINDPQNASKVVDENGEPMVVYHSSNHEFTRFDPDRIGTTNDLGFYGRGFYFTPNEQYSKTYGEVSYPVFLNIREPFMATDMNSSWASLLYNREDDSLESMVDEDVVAQYKEQLEGADGVIHNGPAYFRGGEPIFEIVASKPNQIKSATENNGEFSESDDIRYRKAEPFYSNAKLAVENIKQNKATPEQWLAMIKKDGGLKAGEDKWMGLSDWLTEQKEKGVKTLTKDEVLAFIRANEVQIEEVEYNSNPQSFEDLKEEYEELLREEGSDAAHDIMVDRFGDDFDIAFDDLGGELTIANEEAAATLLGSGNIINSTRLDYTTEGLENKKEIAFVVPSIEPWNQTDAIHFGDAGEGRAVAWVRFGETTDEDGNRVLVIDEVQSKRHDEGRAKGYQSKEEGDLLAERERLYDKMYRDGLTEEEFNRRNEINARLEELGEGRIPDAPFDKNYHELVMKRMLRYAAENGFDKVAWTKGKQQAMRYGLSQEISEIAVKAKGNGKYLVVMEDKLGSELMEYRGSGKEMTAEELSSLVGNELSKKLIEGAEKSRGKEWNGKGYNPEYFAVRGTDLSIGGEDRNALYDEMIPRFMNKYTKKWGTKVGEVTLPEVEEAGRTMWSVDVTPEMKESVMQGQPMFREGMGAISDREVSYENDPIAKWQGKPRYYGKRASAFAERERARMQKGVEEAAKILGVEVEIITDASTLKGRKAKAKGWYDINSKKVVVVIPNHVSKGDAVRTVLHEGVAHHGLRELFGDGFDAMLDNIYNNVAPELKARIDAIAERTGVSTSVATEEYLASLAEDTNFEYAKRTGWWTKIKGYFMKMLNKLGMPGLNLKEELTDNELRYLLWRSYQNLVDPNSFLKPLGYLDDVAKQKELKVGNYAENTVATPRVADSKVDEPSDIKPVGKGKFGYIYDQFKGKAKEAIAFLLKVKGGEAIGALHHSEIGDISLVWGNNKAGLEKIARKHPEVLPNLQKIIDGMRVVSKSDNRIKLESKTHFAVVSREYLGQPRDQWLLTAYEKKETSKTTNSSMDVDSNPMGKSDDTATRQNSDVSSFDKDSNNSSAVQEENVKYRVSEEIISEAERRNRTAEIVDEGPFSDEEREQAIIEESAKLGVKVRVAHSTDELDADAQKDIAKGKPIKGYYDTRTGEVVIYAPHATSENDVKRTILHETVGHKGLRKLLGEDNFNKMMVQMYRMLPEKVRQKLNPRMEREGWSIPVVMEEYLSEQAERDVKPTWWGRINANLRAFLRKLGFDVKLNDADVTYLLWRSRKRLQGDTAYDMAVDGIMKNAAKKKATEDEIRAEEGIRERTARQEGRELSDAITEYYEKYTATTNAEKFWGGVKYMLTHLGDRGLRALLNDISETQLEDIRSVRVLEEAIESAEGRKLQEHEMVHKSLNAKSSKDAREMEKSQARFFQPLTELLGEILGKKIDGRKMEIDDVERYLICKHSKENNEFLMKRAHAENKRKRINERTKELMKGSMTEEEAIAQATSEYTLHQSDFRDDYSGLTELFPDAMVREAKIAERIDELIGNGIDEDTARQKAVEAFKDYQPTLEDREKMAEEEVNRFESASEGLHHDLWRIINGINRDTIDRLFNSGLISRSLYNDLKKRHKFYVPLSGWKNDAAADIYDYATYGVDTTPIQTVIKKAYGTKYQARNILGAMFAMNSSAITEGSQNLVKQKLYNLALNHKTGVLQVVDLWEVKEGEGENAVWRPAPQPELRPTMSDAEMQKVLTDYQNKLSKMESEGKARKAVNSLSDNFGKHVTDREAKRHHVELLVNGMKVVIWVNGNPKLAQAINGDLTKKDELLFFTNAVKGANRFLAQVQTSLNPEFMIGNFERDILSASRYNLAMHGAKYEAIFLKHLAQLMPIIAATNSDTRGDAWGSAGIFNLFALDRNTNNPNRKPGDQVLDMNNKLHREFVNFLNHGGKTGYVERKQAEDLQTRIEKLSKREQSILRKWPAEMAGWAVDTIERLNEGIENATRFAAYLAARDSGMSITEAVFEAKEVSVNFNMHGSGAWGNSTYRLLYNYFNVGLQALRREKNLFREAPVAYIAEKAFLISLGAAATMLLGANFDDDDEDEYMGLSEFNRYNYINIKSKDGFYHYSLPQDMRAFYAIGCISTEWASGKIDATRALQAYATQVNNYTPLSFVSTTIDREPDSNPLKQFGLSVVPSAAVPFAEIMVNEDFLGRRINNQNQWNEYEPEWQRAGYRTPEAVVNASKTLSKLGGGTDHKRGVWFTEINPSNAWHVMDSYGGGFLDFAQKTYNLVERELTGEEHELRDYPMVSKFYVESGQDYSKQRVVNDRYRMYREDYMTIDNELKGYLKDKNNKIAQLNARANEKGMSKADVESERNAIETAYNEQKTRIEGSPNYWIYEAFESDEKRYNRIESDLSDARKTGSEDKVKELSGKLYDMRKGLVDNLDAERDRTIDRVRRWLGN